MKRNVISVLLTVLRNYISSFSILLRIDANDPTCHNSDCGDSNNNYSNNNTSDNHYCNFNDSIDNSCHTIICGTLTLFTVL